MECPRCGYEQPSGDECGGCGIVFAKFFAAQSRALQALEPPAAPSPPTPPAPPQAPAATRPPARPTVAFGAVTPPSGPSPYMGPTAGGWADPPSAASPEAWGAAPSAPPAAPANAAGPAAEPVSWATAFDAPTPNLPSDQGPSAWPAGAGSAPAPNPWATQEPSAPEVPQDSGPTAWSDTPNGAPRPPGAPARPERAGTTARRPEPAGRPGKKRSGVAVAGLVLGTLGAGVGIVWLVEPGLFTTAEAPPTALVASSDAPTAPPEGRLPDTALGRFTSATLEMTDGLSKLLGLEGEAGYDYWERLEGQVDIKRLETLYLALPENDKLRAFELWQVLKTLGPAITAALDQHKRPSGDGYAFRMPSPERAPLEAQRVKLRESAKRLEERIQVF